MGRYHSSVQYELAFNEQIFAYQKKMLLWLCGTLLLVGFLELVYGSFFDYPYLQAPTISSILAFWPLLLYGFTMASFSSYGIISTQHDFELFSKGMMTSVLAGLWEELGYRCLFICTAMIAITWANVLWNGVLSIILGVALIGFGLWTTCSWKKDFRGIRKFGMTVLGLTVTIAGVAATYVCFINVNPAHLFYEYIVVPTIWVITLTTFEDVLYNEKSPRLFIYGAVLANAWFRDGHKYQGIVGIINSWIVGFVMLYAVLHYGLWTAVILHMTYDLFFDVCHFVVRKCAGDNDQKKDFSSAVFN